jgi:kojibiose phosphorylase
VGPFGYLEYTKDAQTAAVHGILAAWMGRMGEAEKFLEKVVDIDMSLEKKGAAEQ